MTSPLRDPSILAAVATGAIADLSDAVAVLDTQGRILATNLATADRVNIPLQDLIGRPLLDVIPDQDRELTQHNLDRALGGEVGSFRVVSMRDGGPERTADVALYPIRDGDDVVAVLGLSRDITGVEAERTEHAELEERLSLTLNAISDGIVILDHDLTVTYLNPRALEIMRVSLDTVLGRSLWESLPEGVDGPYAKAYRRAIETGTQQHVRAFAEQLAGWLDVTAYPTASGLALYIRDVTIDELAHQESAATQRRLADQARLLDASRDAMVVRSLDHTIEYWNSAASTLYGWSVIEAYGRSARELLFDDKAAFDNATGALLRNGYWSGELEQRTHDGRTIIVESRWQLILDDHGAPSSVFAVSTDVTEERRTVDARLRTQRMESLGTLAGGIAHDLNNVLTPILMSIQLLQQREQDESARGLLSGMEGAVKRGADMINQVLSFARGVEGRRIHVSLADLLDGVAVFVRDTLPKNIGVTIDRVDVDDDVDVDEHTLGDPTQLMQVLINLVTNARDAMPNGGHLRIGATRVFVDDQYISATHEVTPGSYLSIEVEDDGDGMPPEVVAKVFEPFYTTKALGRGTGLGLSTSLAIVRSHGGFMQVYSEVGNGTKLQVALPVVPIGEADGDHPDRPEDQLPQGAGELILVIDDEPMILQVTAQTLTSYGYRVHTASNGRDAIDVAESAGEPIDLVLTDMMMPVMDGAATSAYFEDHYPQTPIVAMSGLSSYGTVSRTVGMGIARFLPKPFTTSQLLTAVHDTLHDSLHDTLHEGLHDRDADGDDAP